MVLIFDILLLRKEVCFYNSEYQLGQDVVIHPHTSGQKEKPEDRGEMG